ncbi:MAG: Aspartate aminotransferase [Promethearchaeota archaeon]|nr:MAG: Aspartate aminotransferase [Candidatus Lokiarchaeota archaeon]
MKELSNRLKEAPKSKIRELFDYASGKSDVISLGIGQPDFNTPGPAIEGNIEALKENITMYAPTRGIPDLLEQIEKKLKRDNNIEVEWKENLILSNGGSQGLALTFASLFNEGDELILFSPNFISYYYLAEFYGVKVREISRKKDFSPDFEKMRDVMNENTKAILINSPNNPTGYAFNGEEIKTIAEIVIKNDLYLISDEVYEFYYYDGFHHLSPASLDDMFERTITINAMSKHYSATGFRLGFVAARKAIIDLMEKYHQYTVAGTNHAAQYGYLEALKMKSSFFDDILKTFDERRNLVYDRLVNMGFDVNKPRGAFYIMPSAGSFGMTGSEFSERIIQEKAVAIVPGNIFGSYSDDKLRISYATEISKLKEAMDRIEDFVDNL